MTNRNIIDFYQTLSYKIHKVDMFMVAHVAGLVEDRDEDKLKNKLFSKGCRNIVLALLEKERRWSELEKIEDKRTVSECIDLLINLNFAESFIDYTESLKGVKKYRLTELGKKFAKQLKEITKIVDEVTA